MPWPGSACTEATTTALTLPEKRAALLRSRPASRRVSALETVPDPGFQYQAVPDSRPGRVLAAGVRPRPSPIVPCACVHARMGV